MVDYYKLDKILEEGVDYKMPNDRFYIIEKIGTNSTNGAKLTVDGVELGELISTVAPLHKNGNNLLGMLELGDYFYVIPPSKDFKVEGSSGDKIRIVGKIGKLSPGEVLPANYATRFNEQGNKYLTYVSGSVTLAAAGGNWAADAVSEVLSLTPKTIETYKFSGYVLAELANPASAPSEGDVALRFKLDGMPLDILTSEPGHKGIDYYSMPIPTNSSSEREPFSLADMPIVVKGDHTISIEALNVSGSAIAADSGSDMTMTVYAIVEYSKA